MKKILIVNTKYKIRGGEDSNIIDEIDFLKQHYEIKYLEFDNKKKLKLTEYLSFISNSNKSSNQELIRVLKSFNPDVAYVHNLWFRGNLKILKILKNKQIKTLIKIHNFRYYCANSFFINNHIEKNGICNACNLQNKPNRLFNKYYQDSYLKSFFLIVFIKKYLKYLKDDYFSILAITKFHKSFLVKEGIPKKNIFEFPNPIKFINKDIKNINNLQYVVYAGRLSEDKGIQSLLEIWKILKFENITLKIFGDGPLKDYLSKKYSSKNTIFYGELENDKIIDEISNSKAVITMTKMYEGQPRLLCEASSLGVPSIFPNFGGMHEFFPEDYKLKFNQFDNNDIKKKLLHLNNFDLLEEQGIEAQKYLKKLLENKILLNNFREIVS